MSALAYTRSGAGAPLVLLHGIGSSRHAWDPVVPALAGHFDVLAIDLPGSGDSEPLPPEAEPRPVVLAAAVAGLLDDLGITTPHIAPGVGHVPMADNPPAVTALITASAARGLPTGRQAPG